MKIWSTAIIGAAEVGYIGLTKIENKNKKWKISSYEKARDIRQLNIPFEYSEFYKADLTNDSGQDFSIILCRASEDWLKKAEEHKKNEKIDRTMAGIEI